MLLNKRPDDMARITTPELAEKFIEEQVSEVRAQVGDKKVYYASNIAMYPNSYTLGLTYDFELLLNQYKDIMED